MMTTLALIIVLLLGLYLVALAVASWWFPTRVKRFLSGFASSALAHYLEVVVRLIAGGAVVVSAPHMLFSSLFVVVGWVLIVTTVGLVAIPWRWHQRFAQWAVPKATRQLGLVAVASFAFGGFVVASLVLGGGVQR